MMSDQATAPLGVAMSVESLLAKASEGIHAGRAFGPPVEADGCTVIPVAFAAGGGGGGDAPAEAGAGSGGGFGTVSWPLGVYVIKDGQAKWVPAVDATRVALGVLALVRAAVRARRKRHSA